MAWLEEGFRHRNVYQGSGNRTAIPNLSRAHLEELPIPHPPIYEQGNIAAILDAIGRRIDLHRRKRVVLEESLSIGTNNEVLIASTREGTVPIRIWIERHSGGYTQ